MSHKTTIHLLVSGRVQGVGFRHFVHQKAKECQLNGWVKNLTSGKVEIEVEGDKADLACFIDYVKLGNGYSRTDQLKQNQVEPTANYSEFRIQY